ncbi:Type I Iterative PKS [Diatrype stigma]|uniref:Type I Iterative PKS n=1 Tax=Diatrype stigma TaxID=117547 RepID=A0AAN9UPC2_9PEZI
MNSILPPNETSALLPSDDVAVVGYSYRLPQGVDDDAAFWDVLQGRRNLMTSWPESRLNLESFSNKKQQKISGPGGHFVTEDVAAFDAPFFSVTAKEAASMDPLQRWSLEAAYRAFEKGKIQQPTNLRDEPAFESLADVTAALAGIPATSLGGSRTAVFSASMIEDFARLSAADPENVERTAATGSVVSCVIPNRVSWYFDLRGPSVHVNTACSSSLTAVDLACKVLKCGDASCMLSTANFLSPNSRCHSFDDRADGYARGEGVVAVVLKPVSAAVRDGDMIRAVIRSTGSNQDGQTPVLTQPSPQAQEDLIRHVYAQANLPLNQTRYFEAHANIGHLEGASALASIVKCILILEKGMITPNALFENMNPAIDADFYNIRDCAGRRAGNESTPALPLDTGAKPPTLLVWTAADEKAVARTIAAYETYYTDRVLGHPGKLESLAFTLAARRTLMLWRTFAVVAGADGILPKEGEKSLGVPARATRSSAPGDLGLAFVFTGQGAQYVDMGWDLVQFPVFAETLRRIDDNYRIFGCEWSVFDELRNKDNIDKPEYSQPLSTAVQIALLELLKSFGVVPKAVVGHSSGEISAAYAAGALNLPSACKVSYYRGQLAGKLRAANAAAPGAMLSVNLAEDRVADYLQAVPGDTTSVGVACINSPGNCTLSGPEAAIDAVKAQAEKEGMFAVKVKTGVAYHSSSMLEIANEYRSLMGTLEGAARGAGAKVPAATTCPMVSSVTGKPIRLPELVKAQYWVENMVSPVRFADAVQVLTQKSSTIKIGLGSITDLVEIGPHPALKRPIQDTVGQEGNKKKVRYASTLHRSQPAAQAVLELVGQLFCLGHEVSVAAANGFDTASEDKSIPPAFLVDCPGYPFDHSNRYWAESRISRDYRLRGTVHGESLGQRVSDWNPLEPRWRNFLSIESTPWIGDHVVSDTVLFPAAGMLVMAIEAVQQMIPPEQAIAGYLVQKAEFLSPIVVQQAWEDRAETQVRLLQPPAKQSGRFDVSIFSYARDRWTECCRARIQVEREGSETEAKARRAGHEDIARRYAAAVASCTRPLDSSAWYRDEAELGLRYGESFQLLQDIAWDGATTAVVRVGVSSARYQLNSLVHPAVLDTLFHALRVSAGQQPVTNVPVRLHDAWFAASGWQHPHTASIRWLAASDSVSTPGHYGEKGSVFALSDDGKVLCAIRKTVTATVSAESKKQDKKLMYTIEWKPQLSMLEPKRLAEICHVDEFGRNETAVGHKFKEIYYILELVVARVLQGVDLTKVPKVLVRHVEWMQYVSDRLPPSQLQEAETLSDEAFEAKLRRVESLLPAWELYTLCARKLPAILAGELDPLQVVFGSGLADVFYEDLFVGLCADGRLGTLLDLASHENPALRILEVGAGTGGMTGHFISIMEAREKRTGAPAFAEYTYSDISPMFFERARARWPQLEAQGRMLFKTLDLDRPVAEQGFEPESYDMVVAASVLHATADLEANIRHVRRALKPGGRLVLLEAVCPDNVATNFMAGLLPGWWIANETWRPHSPAITESMWDTYLRRNGFSGNDLVIRDYQEEEIRVMSILITTAVGENELTPQPPTKKPGRVLLVVDENQSEIASAVKSRISPNDNDPIVTSCSFTTDDLSKAVVGMTADDIVISLIEVDNQPVLSNLSAENLQCLQQLMKLAPNILWASSADRDDPQYPDHAVMQGFFRSLRAEQPDSHLVSVFIGEKADFARHSDWIVDVYRASFISTDLPSSQEVDYVVRDGVVTTGRAVENVPGNATLQSLLSQQLQHRSWGEGPALQLSIGSRGSLDSLQFVRDETYRLDLAPGEIEIEASAWGLSNVDVQVALGNIDGVQNVFGSDCTGVVTRVGRDCRLPSDIQPGDRVCMLAQGCMRKYPRAPETAVVKLPASLSPETAASALVPTMTALHALINVARLEEGDTVLIHSAASAMGQAAVQLAQMHGAKVFMTASPDKQHLIVQGLGVPQERVFDNQTTSFAGDVLRATGGQGVDVIFNLLPGEDTLLASCRCLSRNGRFVEVSRNNIEADDGTTLPMAVFTKNISFASVDIMQLNPKVTARLLAKTVQLLGEGKVQPPQPVRIFNASEIGQAFKETQGEEETVGRAVIVPSPVDIVPQLLQEQRPWQFNPDASYLISGGSGGLGRAILQWMAERGAKHLIVPSRSGATSRAASSLVADLTALGVEVFAPQCDVSSERELAHVLSECARRGMPPVRGCINAAMVLQDAIFQDSMTLAQWELTMRSKAQTAQNLHRLLSPSSKGGNLDFFIMLSSLAGVIGQMASANYASGCAYQDALVRHRRLSAQGQGERAFSLDIGWMRNVGIIAETSAYQRQRVSWNDMQPIDDVDLLALLTLCCDPSVPAPVPAESHGQILFGLRTPADLLAQGKEPPALLLDKPLLAAFSFLPDAGASVLSRAAGEGEDAEMAAAAASFRRSSDSSERIQIVLRALAAKLARAMGTITADDVEPGRPLSAYGVDSLMAVEIRNWFGREFGATVAVFDIMGGAPISAIADLVVERSTVGKV